MSGAGEEDGDVQALKLTYSDVLFFTLVGYFVFKALKRRLACVAGQGTVRVEVCLTAPSGMASEEAVLAPGARNAAGDAGIGRAT
eukprot:CAMPEP_0204170660 /NCGR_PEP_ID=MMETSP0361-20130328/42574_1 /ASSEMBLY_ACC=CAM_ASM_000343 /TAXON_ID=268821 /ORGANISM="Scrippsiella Hangoei, Strain SHTV-5" /LENGTH=84 /DNA_ID=CAMNT_0051128429 /DNA_START=72 /DNA_END=322 /DNA_ORIENTATION=+